MVIPIARAPGLCDDGDVDSSIALKSVAIGMPFAGIATSSKKTEVGVRAVG
jgi:hypothetical protein